MSGTKPCITDPEKEYFPEDPANPDPNEYTLCSRDTSDNIFFVPRAPGYPYRCILDEMTYEQVTAVLERIPEAREDLMRITDDPTLLNMAMDVPLTEGEHEDADQLKAKLDPVSLPYYSVLNGNIDGTVR